MKSIQLDSRDWEVSLVEVQVPITWHKIREDDCWLYVDEHDPIQWKQFNHMHKVILPAGLYKDAKKAFERIDDGNVRCYWKACHQGQQDPNQIYIRGEFYSSFTGSKRANTAYKT